MRRFLVGDEELGRIRIGPDICHRQNTSAGVLHNQTRTPRVNDALHLQAGAAATEQGPAFSVSRISSGNLPPQMLAPPRPVPEALATGTLRLFCAFKTRRRQGRAALQTVGPRTRRVPPLNHKPLAVPARSGPQHKKTVFCTKACEACEQDHTNDMQYYLIFFRACGTPYCHSSC